ncbi:MAG: hypothetical protein ACE5I3_05120 [Phycisphaerae bacterium]
MTPAEGILIVAAGALLTLLIGGALLFWIDREWRDLDARQRQPREAPRRPDAQDNSDKSPADEPPGS